MMDYIGLFIYTVSWIAVGIMIAVVFVPILFTGQIFYSLQTHFKEGKFRLL